MAAAWQRFGANNGKWFQGQKMRRAPTGRRKRTTTQRRFVAFESLERRELLAADIAWSGGGAFDAWPAALVGGGEGETAATDIVRYRLELTDTSNQPLPVDANGHVQASVGQTIRLHGYNRDARGATNPPGSTTAGPPKGVFAAYMDVFYTNANLLTVRHGETQQITFEPTAAPPGSPTPEISGQFRLTFDGQTTSSITYTSDYTDLAPVVQERLEALTNVGVGNVKVTVLPVTQDALLVRFVNALGERDVPMINVDTSQLVNFQDATVIERFPADLTDPGTFWSSFRTVSPFTNGQKAVNQTDLEPGQPAGGRTLASVGSFLDGFGSPSPTKEFEFFQVDLRLDGAGLVEFSGNPSDAQGTETLIFPANPSAPNFVVDPVNIGFIQDINHPLVLNILPRNVFTVTSTDDTPDANIGDGICADANGVCTLRAAIQEANATANLAGGPDLIQFDIPGAGVHTIRPTSPLPTITSPVVIDATSQPGYGPARVIELDGSLAGAGASGLKITGGSTTVKGLAINRFSVSGIDITNAGDNRILGNFIGTNAAGTSAAANGKFGISATTANNQIGGTGAGEGNVISGNLDAGVRLAGSGATGNTVQGNRIGTNAAGTAAVANKMSGVAISGDNNLVGGATSAAANVVSGNGKEGVLLWGASNQVFGNLIGTDAAGTSAVPNVDYGVVAYTSGNQIGGAATGQEGNVISGNRYGGILLRGPNNSVQHNLIGTDITGMADIGNAWTGVVVDASGNTIGGVGDAGNVISGNSREGISLYKPGNSVYGNLIGTDRTGTSALKNDGWGMYILTYNSQVGGVGPGRAGNVISNNGQGGIQLYGTGAHDNTIQANLIGLDKSGTAGLGNTGFGVYLNRAYSNIVGGSATGTGNVISANTREGISISGDPATNNSILGNRVGTNAAGTVALGNSSHGILITARGNHIGGTTAGAGNLVSGNAGSGVVLSTSTARLNTIQGNRIGTDVTGKLILANRGGVLISGNDNTLGGGATGAGNLISGNQGDGVQIYGTRNQVRGNVIGPDATGTNLLGNMYGVVLYGPENTVGGVGSGEGNRIAGNGYAGIRVTGAGAIQNAITRNSLWKNGGLGIDLGPTGVTANDMDDADADTGPNQLQNFPVISAASVAGASLAITYSVPSSPTYSQYPLTVEFFQADADGQEGQTYVGTDTYSAAGAKTVTLPQSGVSVGKRIVATATDANGNTSEFSANAVVAAPLVAAAPGSWATLPTLDTEQLGVVVWQAISTWEAAGLDAARVAALRSLSFAVEDLPDPYLGFATPDRIVLDIDAAGHGWYVSGQSNAPVPEDRIDLLSAVLHEMGHVLGLADFDGVDGLMADVLRPGTRREPTSADVDQVLAGASWLVGEN